MALQANVPGGFGRQNPLLLPSSPRATPRRPHRYQCSGLALCGPSGSITGAAMKIVLYSMLIMSHLLLFMGTLTI